MKAETLKKSILQYAMQGKLVAQDPNDEPASKLLKRIKAEKEQLIKEGKIKKEKPLPLISENEKPYKLPQGWEWVRLGNICNLYTGNSIPENLKFSKYSKISDGFDYIGTKDVTFDNNIIYNNGIKIPIDETNFKYAYNNSILLCIEGGSAGKKISISNKQICFGNKLCAFNTYQIIPKFLYYFMQSPIFLNIFTDNKSGIIGGVSIAKLKELCCCIPPVTEQQRIVDKLERILPLVNEYKKNEEELSQLNLTLPTKIKQSILQYAVQGKLVEQKPNDEPARELLKRIKAEKEQLIKEGKIKKEKPLPPITEDEVPFEIPQNWKWIRLGDLFAINPRNSTDDNSNAGFIPMTQINDGYWGGHTYEKRKWGEIKKGFTHFRTGDIAIAKITPCFQNRKSTIISKLPNNIGAGTTELHIIRDYTQILNMKYILLMLKTEAFIKDGVKNFTGTAGQQRIGKDFIINYLIPLPPLAEQERIVQKVEQLLNIINQFES